MSSHEYHKLMSEVYFTRSIMWLLNAGICIRVMPSDSGTLLSVLSGIWSIQYLYRSLKEDGKARR